MKIKEMLFQNYKKFSDNRINLDSDLTVLIGKNNAGKSSLLESIELLLLKKSIETHTYLLSKNNNTNGTGTVVISMLCYFNKEEWNNCFQLSNINFDQYVSRPDTAALLDLPIKIERSFYYIDHILKSHSPSQITCDNQFMKNFKESDKNGVLNAIERLSQSLGPELYRFTNIFYFSGDRYIHPTEGFIPFNQLKQDPSRQHTRNELFYLKKRDEKNYAKIMDRIGDFFSELGDIDVEHNLDTGMIELQIKEGDFNTGLEQMGSGTKRIIQILSRILSAESTIAVLDEPETHMHPKLIKKFVDCINELSDGNIQLIIATHNEIFIDSIEPSKIIVIKPLSPVVSEINYLSNYKSKISHLLNELDITQDNFSKFETTLSKVIVFAEGNTDWKQIIEFAKKVNMISVLESSEIHFIPLGGYKILRDETINILSRYNMPFLVLYDRDERTAEEIRKIEEKLSTSRVHYLKKREIENYVIESHGIYNLIRDRLIKRESYEMPELSEQLVEEKIKQLADKLKRKVIIKGFLERLSSQLSLQFLQYDSKGKFIEMNIDKTDQDLINAFYSSVLKAVHRYTESELITILETIKKEINDKWESEYLSLCPGKDLLVEIRKWLQKEYQISDISTTILIQYLNNVDSEIIELINKIIKQAEK